MSGHAGASPFGNKVIQALRKQCHLLSIVTFYESLHPVTHAE
jgi:hypothetical protein